MFLTKRCFVNNFTFSYIFRSNSLCTVIPESCHNTHYHQITNSQPKQQPQNTTTPVAYQTKTKNVTMTNFLPLLYILKILCARKIYTAIGNRKHVTDDAMLLINYIKLKYFRATGSPIVSQTSVPIYIVQPKIFFLCSLTVCKIQNAIAL